MFAVLFANDPAGHAAANPLQPDFVTMGVTLVVFLVLLGVLYATAWKPIMKGLAAREGAILDARDAALRTKAEAEEMRAKLNAEMAAAQDKIRGLLDEARKDAEALRAREKEVGTKEAQAERERATREIQAAKEQAMQELQQQAVQLAALMSSKAVRRTVTADDHRRLLDESLAELKTSVTRA